MGLFAIIDHLRPEPAHLADQPAALSSCPTDRNNSGPLLQKCSPSAPFALSSFSLPIVINVTSNIESLLLGYYNTHKQTWQEGVTE